MKSRHILALIVTTACSTAAFANGGGSASPDTPASDQVQASANDSAKAVASEQATTESNANTVKEKEHHDPAASQ
jgi:hypothetical protein